MYAGAEPAPKVGGAKLKKKKLGGPKLEKTTKQLHVSILFQGFTKGAKLKNGNELPYEEL
jgi:hypothetical protein